MHTYAHRIRTVAAAAALVAATLVVLGGRADAATGPTFVGGQSVSASDGSDSSSLSYNGSVTLVVWTQPVGSGSDIYGRIMAPDTTSIGNPFPISTATNRNEADPDVAWDGTSWLVVWDTTSSTSLSRPDIHGRRVSSSGGLLGSELTISSTPADQVGPSVAAGANGQFLVVWEDFRNLKTDVDIYGQRVTKAGALLDGSGRRLSNDSTSSSSDDSRPDVAWNGSTYLTVFRSQDTGESISGRAIRPDGTVAFSGDIVSSPDSDLELSWPVIASNGSDFLIAFNLRYPGTDHGTDVWSARITDFDADATVAPIVQADGEQLYPAITFNGNYLVAWEEGDDIWAGRLRPNGTVLDGAVITGPKTADASVALAPGGSKANQFAYSWSATPPNGLSGVGALGVQFAPK